MENMKIETWNYNPPNGSEFQRDWNQTIVTMFNYIHQTYHKDEEKLNISSPIKYKSIFDSLLLDINDKFNICFSETLNTMIVGGVNLEILNFMDEKLKDVNLLDELRETMEDVEIQLYEDEKRYGDTWKERGLVYKGMNQETRWFYKMQDYFQDFVENAIPIPWDKVIGEAHIAKVREKKLK